MLRAVPPLPSTRWHPHPPAHGGMRRILKKRLPVGPNTACYIDTDVIYPYLFILQRYGNDRSREEAYFGFRAR